MTGTSAVDTTIIRQAFITAFLQRALSHAYFNCRPDCHLTARSGNRQGIARRLGEVGCNVLIISRSLEAAERVAKEIGSAGGSASAAAIDVADADQASSIAEIATQRYGAIDILCANAQAAMQL
jgi:hypothetical protein